MDRLFTAIATRVSAFAGQPIAFILALAAIILWAATGPIFQYSDTWQLIVNTSTTIITFLMVFIIQNSQNRDGAALQAKLDELIRALEGPRNEFIGIEHLSEAELEKIRTALEKEVSCNSADEKDAHDAVDRLIRRF